MVQYESGINSYVRLVFSDSYFQKPRVIYERPPFITSFTAFRSTKCYTKDYLLWFGSYGPHTPQWRRCNSLWFGIYFEMLMTAAGQPGGRYRRGDLDHKRPERSRRPFVSRQTHQKWSIVRAPYPSGQGVNQRFIIHRGWFYLTQTTLIKHWRLIPLIATAKYWAITFQNGR